jgi:four helix bundle protein
MKVNSYKDLLVWQKSIKLVEEIYKLTANLPATEKFGIASQMQRAAVSVPSNIAEGYMRNGLAEYIQFCGIAADPLAELETQTIILSKVYPDVDVMETTQLIEESQKMLYAMIRQLKTKR